MIENQRQAYLNEFKGNLFEYLVGRKLAERWSLEKVFLESIQPDAMKFLSHYELELRKLSPDLPTKLNELAEKLCEYLVVMKPFLDILVKEILLVGKVKGNYDKIEMEESDLLIVHENGVLPLSLKLVKDKSFINTKSAGVRTFFEKYFIEENIQAKINDEIDIIYESMARKLHENHDIDYNGNFQLWKEQGFPELPGKLEEIDKKVLHKSYNEICQLFYEEFLRQSKKPYFLQKLNPLMGSSNQNLIQVVCFHSDTTNYKFEGLQVENYNKVEELILDPDVPKNSLFNLRGKNKIFQIRIKPMNKFTVASFKVNCSVKYL